MEPKKKTLVEQWTLTNVNTDAFAVHSVHVSNYIKHICEIVYADQGLHGLAA